MKFAAKMCAGMLVFGGLLGVYFLDSAHTAKKELQTKENGVALYFQSNDCIKFSMKNTNGIFTFERENPESPWHLTSPRNVMADQDAVNSTLLLLKNISVQRELSADNNLEQYGFNTSSLRFEITLKNKTIKTLSFGKNVTNNSASFQLPSVYAQASGRPILVVDNSSLSSFEEKKYEDFRTKQISNFKTFQVSKIKIQQTAVIPQHAPVIPRLDRGTQTDTIELISKNNEWHTTAPIAVGADNIFIPKYLQKIHELTANQILELPTDDILQANGISRNFPSALLTFEDSNGKLLQELSLYMTKTGIYINMADGSFAQVTLDEWPDLVPKFKNFRNRSLSLSAQTKCDVNFNEISIDDILDNVSPLDLQKLGFQTPLKTFSCSSETEKKFDILIGNHVPLNEKNVYLKRSDSNTVYIVNSESLSRLAQR